MRGRGSSFSPMEESLGNDLPETLQSSSVLTPMILRARISGMNSLMTSRTQVFIRRGRCILGSSRLQHRVGLASGHGASASAHASAPGVTGIAAIPHTVWSRTTSQVPARIRSIASKAGAEGGRGALLLGRVLAGVAATAAACFWLDDERVALALGAYGLPIGDKYPRVVSPQVRCSFGHAKKCSSHQDLTCFRFTVRALSSLPCAIPRLRMRSVWATEA